MPLPTFDLLAELNKPFRVVVFGSPGKGKTWGALTFPRPNIIDFDSGSVVGLHPKFIAKWGHKKLLGKSFSDKDLDGKGVPIGHRAFDEATEYVAESMLPENIDSFDTWIVDSGTSLGRAAMFKALLLMNDGSVGQTSNTLKGARKTGAIVPKMQDYGAQRSMMEQFISRLKESNKMLIFICHEYEEKDDSGNTTAIRPLLTGGSREAIPAMFNETYAISLEGVGQNQQAVCTTEKSGFYESKSRLGIPSRTPWNWPALEAALSKRRAEVQAQLNQSAP